MIPALMGVMTRLMAAYREAGEARDRLQTEQRRIALSGGGILDGDAWRAGREDLGRSGAVIQEGLREIATMGGVPKDLGMGLVDFPHLREGREVNLCWRHGEWQIRFWHGLDEGYAGRKSL